MQFHLGEVYNALGRKREALDRMRLAMEKVGPLGSEMLSRSIGARIEELEFADNMETSNEGAVIEN